MKRVYLDFPWKSHSLYNELIYNPPEGYEFVTSSGLSNKLFTGISKISFTPFILGKLREIVPTHLIKSHIDKYFEKPPFNTDLTFSLWHLVTRNEPWVIELDGPMDPIGGSIWHLNLFKNNIKKSFNSSNCKKILCWSETSKKAIVSSINCSEFEHKLEVVPRAVRKKIFIKTDLTETIKILFIGSINLNGVFEMRGGLLALEAFRKLNNEYKNLELIIRSQIPDYVKKDYADIIRKPNVRIIESVLPIEGLDQLYKEADIFWFPGYYNAWLAMLEAMSYELPVIVTDVHSTHEYIENGRTGFLIKPSQAVQYYQDGLILSSYTKEFMKAIQRVDYKVVDELAGKTCILVDNTVLRRNIGRNARRETEYGKFSLDNRNNYLKRIFDEATNASNK